MSLMQPIYEGGNRFKADPASYLTHIWAVRWLNFLRGFWFLNWPNLWKPTVHSQKPNLELDLADRSKMQYIVCPQAIIQYNIIQKSFATYVAFCDFSTRPLSQASTKEKAFHYCAKKILQEEGHAPGWQPFGLPPHWFNCIFQGSFRWFTENLHHESRCHRQVLGHSAPAYLGNGLEPRTFLGKKASKPKGK